MSVEHSRSDYLPKAGPLRWRHAPAWWLRLQLRAAVHAIGRLERALADEFGLQETAPQLRELEALRAERELLLRRLAQRGGGLG